MKAQQSHAGGCPSGSSAYVAEYVHKVGGNRKTEGPFCINDNAFSDRNKLGAALRKAGVLMSGARVVSFRIVGGENIAVFPSAPGLTTYWHSIVLKPSGTLGGVRETGGHHVAAKRPVVQMTIQDEAGTVLRSETKSAFNSGVRASEVAIREIAIAEHTVYEGDRPVSNIRTVGHDENAVYTRRWVSRNGKVLIASVTKESDASRSQRDLGETNYVADFNTLEDLVAHAARDLGATHAIIAGPETKIFFPRGGTHSYEEARVWRKGGYWHAEGPGARIGVSRLPSDAKPIGSVRRAAEGASMTEGSQMQDDDDDDASESGAEYADDQIAGTYFMDWVRDQLIEAERMGPEKTIPLETKTDAERLARRMLKQLEWDTKRELSESKEFFEGFSARLADRVVIGWLADELLSMNAEIVGAAVAERPRGTVRAGISPDKKQAAFRRLDHFFGSPANQKKGFASDDAAANSAATLLSAQMKLKYGTAIEIVKEWYRRDDSVVRDYAAVDTRDRVIAGPFKQYSDAKDAAGAGGHVKYVPGKRTREAPKKHDVTRRQNFAGYDFTSGPGGTTIHRQRIQPTTPGEDYGADPLGDGRFRMVPSGDIVDYDERLKRLARFKR